MKIISSVIAAVVMAGVVIAAAVFMPSMLGVFLGILILYGSVAIRYVDKPFNWVVETNFPGGMHAYVWKPGLQFLWFPIKPFMFVRNKVPVGTDQPFKVQMGSDQGLGDPDPVEFADDSAGVDFQVILRVPDEEAAKKATYGIVDERDLLSRQSTTIANKESLELAPYQVASLNRVESYLRSHLGKVKLDDAMSDSERKTIQDNVRNEVSEKIADWGVELVSISITNFRLREATVNIREQLLNATKAAQAQAEAAIGEKNATITIAEGKKQAAITIAQGEREAAKLAGLGEQERIVAVAGAGLDPVHAAAYVVARGANESIAKGNATIIATSEGGNMSFAATVAGIAKGMMGGSNSNTPSTTPPAAPTPPAAAGAPPTAAPAPQAPLSQRKRGGKS